MSGTSKAFLLVADISGFTNFMKSHAVSTNHAKQIVVRLLKSVIDVSKPPLKLAEIEGDAVFFYAISSPRDLKKTADQVKTQVVKFFQSFKQEIEHLKQIQLCKCNACANVGKLQLKQVIHQGDVSIEKIEQFEKLFGLDVIIVHRMLKNSVPSHEYVMMTGETYHSFESFYGATPERRVEQFEGVGEVETLVFYPAAWAQSIPSTTSPMRVHQRPSVFEKIGWTLRLTLKSALQVLGLAKVKGTFNNLPA